MCGLTGYARNPSGAHREMLVKAFNTLLWKSEHRGKHATGVAIHHRRRDAVTIVKRAVPAQTFLASEMWGSYANEMTSGSVQIVQGHVRYATHNNASLDQAAHPFKYESVVGAHNGVIDNWREVEDSYKASGLIVDSEAALVALNAEGDPVTALAKLSGYFALTWVKDGQLFLARTNAAPLAAAYVPSLCALLWHSELDLLKKVLTVLKLDTKWIGNLDHDTIYRFLPSQFGAKSAPTKIPFKHLERVTYSSFNSARPPSWRDEWDGTTARMLPSKSGKKITYSLKDMWEQMQAMADRISDLEHEVQQLNDAVFEPIEEDVLIEEGSGQLDLLPPPEVTTAKCVRCGLGTERGVLHNGVDGVLVHLSCVFDN